MGKIVGAALVSHHPGLMQADDFRIRMGDGADSDLIAGYRRLRERIDAVRPDTFILFDTHWFTTGYHLVDGGAHMHGSYTSDEMPWYLHGQRYDYCGSPTLAALIEEVAVEQGVMSKAIHDDALPRHYATINVVNKLVKDGERVVLLASGALSHKFNEIDWVQKHPRMYHEDNVSRPANVVADKDAIALLEAGRHDAILEQWDAKFRPLPWEGFGGHYLQMIGTLGGAECRSKGTALSDYENARGTGNVHMWFDTAPQEQEVTA